jgi:UDP-N-acetylglucosamine--N-acetylmuramyl-(pentapeptide) pyrophosphoryl-undecaprenol N-acetylglucosamine transferase
MKILLTGGGSGGHFYPIIAIAQEINRIARENHLAQVELFFMSSNPYNAGILFDNKITFKKNSAGKVRRYFSLLNITDGIKTFFGIIKSIWDIFLIYPDVVFGKGGYASFPALVAARILRIPVVIHESDSAPGRTNKWAGKFALRVALSYAEAAQYFPHKDRVAHTGHPVRKELVIPLTTNAHEYLSIDNTLPTILVLGGSLGAKVVNDAILESLGDLVKSYQIIHQTGKANFEEVRKTADVVLLNSPNKNRYRPYEYLDALALRSAAGAASLIISRAGSTIFEIAAWGVPSIMIPITDSNEDHQAKNAFAYARTGAATVIQENNLTGNILQGEIKRILESPDIQSKMKEATKSFVKLDAAEKIAQEIVKIGLRHEA